MNKLQSSNPAGFFIKFEKKLQSTDINMDFSAYIFKKLNPLEEMKKDTNFSLEKSTIEFEVVDSEKGSLFYEELNLEKYLTEFTAFFETVISEVNHNSDIINVREKSVELSCVSKKIEKALLDHISKNYPIEKIQM